MVEFGGWVLPVQYEGVLAEHAACREAAVVFDTSHMGQFVITGPRAAEELAAVCTQDAASLRVGRCRYGFLLNKQGGVIDDTILMRLGDERLLLVVNAGTVGVDFAWLGEHLDAAELVNRSAEGWAKIDLQGPKAFDVLACHVEGKLREMSYFAVAERTCAGRPCVISRTGYTGELGYEIMAAGDDTATVFAALLGDERVTPAGLGARDSLRLEMGYPLYGHELTTETTPVEADAMRFVDPNREFIGAAALRRALEAGPKRRLVAMRSQTRRRAQTDSAILASGDAVGAVTSAAFSPSLGVSIAMGYVRTEHAAVGKPLTIRTTRAELPVETVDTPFYRNGTCRAKLG